MSAVHILLQKEYHLDNKLLSKYTFHQVPDPPTTVPQFAKVVTIQPGEYIDAYECIPSADFSHVDITIYRLSNVDGQLKKDLLESFFMEKNK
jgi:hypothetical protein